MTTPTTTSSGLALAHDRLTAPPVHIPNGHGGSYKTELTLERVPSVRTEKILWWHEDDPREEPHNHPWDFRSTILHGGYDEERFWVDDDGGLHYQKSTYRAGDVNTVPRSVFHNVRSVQPGTVTHMICGPAVDGNVWHYLDTDTLDLLSSDNPKFLEQFRTLNPHVRAR